MDASPAVVTDVLLNLTESLPWSRLVDWHLDGPLPISDHHRSQTAELSVDLTGKEKRWEEEGKGQNLNRTHKDFSTICSNSKTSFPHTLSKTEP